MKAYLCDPNKNTGCEKQCGERLCGKKCFEACRWTAERGFAFEDKAGNVYEISVESENAPGVNGNRGGRRKKRGGYSGNYHPRS